MTKNSSAIAKIIFLFFGIALVIFPITAVNLTPNIQPLPDFLFCFIFISLVRNPKQVSIIQILCICLLADLLWYRPIALTTLTFILGTELLRQYLIIRDKIGLFEELICISSIYIIMTCIQEIVKFFTLIPSLALGDIIAYIFVTLLIYFLFIVTIRIFRTSRLI